MTTDNNTHHFVYEDDVITSATEALAWIEGVEPTSLKPLYAFVDPDALRQLVESGNTTVSFRAYDHEVYITSDGKITIETGVTGNKMGTKV